LAVRILYVRIKTRVATFDANHSVTSITQTVNRFFSSETSRLQSSQLAQLAMGTVDVSGETIGLSMGLRLEIIFFFACNVHKS